MISRMCQEKIKRLQVYFDYVSDEGKFVTFKARKTLGLKHIGYIEDKFNLKFVTFYGVFIFRDKE